MEKTNWKLFWTTIGYMVGAYLIYKVLYVGLISAFVKLEKSPWSVVLYFVIVLILSIILRHQSRMLFDQTMDYQYKDFPDWRTVLLILIPAFSVILFWGNFFTVGHPVINQPPFLNMISILDAFGAALFEETNFRGFGINGLNESLSSTRWKPLVIATVTSAIFAIAHLGNLLLPNGPTLHATLQQLVYAFFFGMVMAIISMKSGTIVYGIGLHFMTDLRPWSPNLNIAQSLPNPIFIGTILFPIIVSIIYLRPSKLSRFPFLKR
ncbi:CPBP family intramembrane glutamic endopeptidase [Furfurilactobacillus sp. WILCCON 0119]